MIINFRSLITDTIEGFQIQYGNKISSLKKSFDVSIVKQPNELAVIQVKIEESQYYQLIKMFGDIFNTRFIIAEVDDIIIYDNYYE